MAYGGSKHISEHLFYQHSSSSSEPWFLKGRVDIGLQMRTWLVQYTHCVKRNSNHVVRLATLVFQIWTSVICSTLEGQLLILLEKKGLRPFLVLSAADHILILLKEKGLRLFLVLTASNDIFDHLLTKGAPDVQQTRTWSNTDWQHSMTALWSKPDSDQILTRVLPKRAAIYLHLLGEQCTVVLLCSNLGKI